MGDHTSGNGQVEVDHPTSGRVPNGAVRRVLERLLSRTAVSRADVGVQLLGLYRTALACAPRRVRGTLRFLRNAAIGSPPADPYRLWVAANTPTGADLLRMADELSTFHLSPRVSIVTPVYNTDPVWLRASIESIRAQIYPNWELCLCDDGSMADETKNVLRTYERDPRIRVAYLPSNQGISVASNAALALATGDLIAFVDHDDEITPDALFQVVKFLNAHPGADVIYSDEDKLDPTGLRCDPFFKPDWSPEHFLSCMYTCHLMVMTRRLIQELGGFRGGYEGAQDYDLVLRAMAVTAEIRHLPKVLYHWRKTATSAAASGLAKPWATDAGYRALHDHVAKGSRPAAVIQLPTPGRYRVRYEIRGTPRVSIVILSGQASDENDGRQLQNCVRSLVKHTAYANYELLIAGLAMPAEPAAERQAQPRIQHVSLSSRDRASRSRSLNAAAREAAGEHLVILDSSLEVRTPQWLSAMLEHSQHEEIGAVGAKLLYPDGRLKHIGLVLGMCGLTGAPFDSHPGWSKGYLSSAVGVRNYSAVSGACVMTRLSTFRELGGFDEELAREFYDIDLCLRLRAAGYRVVFTPYAELRYQSKPADARPDSDDAQAFRRRWSDAIGRDPYYNPNLSKDFVDYRAATR